MQDESSGAISDDAVLIILGSLFGTLILVMIGIYICTYCYKKYGGKSTTSGSRRNTKKRQRKTNMGEQSNNRTRFDTLDTNIAKKIIKVISGGRGLLFRAPKVNMLRTKPLSSILPPVLKGPTPASDNSRLQQVTKAPRTGLVIKPT